MTVRTGRVSAQEKARRERVAGSLAGKFGKATDMILQGKRTPDQAKVLERALQAFRDGQLVGVVCRAQTADAAQLQPVLSLLVADSAMPDDLKKYFRQRGVRYIGEIYKLIWDNRGKGMRERREQVFDFLKLTLGLPEQVNVDVMWRPPYWDDAGFLALLNQPVGAVVTDTGYYDRGKHGRGSYRPGHRWMYARKTRMRFLHEKGIHYAGDYLRSGRVPEPGSHGTTLGDWGMGSIKNKQSTLQKNSGLWAAALVPLDWSAPKEIPSEWVEELLLIDQEMAEDEARALEREQEAQRKHEEQYNLEERKRRVFEKSHGLIYAFRASLASPTDVYEYLRGLNLFRSVDELEISVRNSITLRNARIRFVGELVCRTEAEYLRFKNSGRKSLKEIREALAEMGLSLGMFQDPISLGYLNAVLSVCKTGVSSAQQDYELIKGALIKHRAATNPDPLAEAWEDAEE